MENLSLTDIINESMPLDPAADNQEPVEEVDENLSVVESLINDTDDDDTVDTADEADDEVSEEADDPDLERFQVKVDGEVIDVTLDDLKAGYQRQADYTRKSQALAAERQQFEQTVSQFGDTLQTLQQLDSAWEENPVQVLAHFSANTENPTRAVAGLIKELASAGLLERDFMDIFGITSEVQEAWARENEVQSLRKRAATAETSQSERVKELAYEQEVQKAIAEYDRQIDEILDVEGLDLTVKQRNTFRAKLAQYAHDNELTNLKAAYKALKYEETEKKRAIAKKTAVRAQQKKAASVSTRSGSAPKGAAPITDTSDLSAVIRQAMQEASGS